jgi:hypothetical protein
MVPRASIVPVVTGRDATFVVTGKRQERQQSPSSQGGSWLWDSRVSGYGLTAVAHTAQTGRFQ